MSPHRYKHWPKAELARHIQTTEDHTYLGRTYSFTDLFQMPLALLEDLHREQHDGATHGPDGVMEDVAS